MSPLNQRRPDGSDGCGAARKNAAAGRVATRGSLALVSTWRQAPYLVGERRVNRACATSAGAPSSDVRECVGGCRASFPLGARERHDVVLDLVAGASRRCGLERRAAAGRGAFADVEQIHRFARGSRRLTGTSMAWRSSCPIDAITSQSGCRASTSTRRMRKSRGRRDRQASGTPARCGRRTVLDVDDAVGGFDRFRPGGGTSTSARMASSIIARM